MPSELPIDVIREDVLQCLTRGPVVISSPTGSGKSTQVPRWCLADPPVLVIEPRRVACRSLATRVSELERTPLGQRVGYVVRDEVRTSAATELFFVTPGIALRWAASDRLARFRTILLDEFHERSLDLDVLLGLLLQQGVSRLIVMSATLQGDRVAAHLRGVHLHAPGRTFPVEKYYVPGQTILPDLRGVESRIEQALRLAQDQEGDVLIFLPGKAEIARVVHSLRKHRKLDVLPLHGGLSLREQAKVFQPHTGRRVIVATNVAETSITLPQIRVVIDSGLVRRTRYHQGRGFLTLVPIARDSAEQRAGRAGRTQPGTCYRLWKQQAPLDAITPPEIFRETLVPLVLSCSACGFPKLELPFLDPPKAYAIDSARGELGLLGAIDEDGSITERGRLLYGLPLDVHLGRLLQEAQSTGDLEVAIDLVAVLATNRPLFKESKTWEDDDPIRAARCDATACILAVRIGDPGEHGIDRWALQEARHTARRLRRAYKLPETICQQRTFNRQQLARTILRAWPTAAHVVRRRKRNVAWSNGGTEIVLSRRSLLDESRVDFMASLDTRAIGLSRRQTQIMCTCAMPLTVHDLLSVGLGRDAVAQSMVESGRVIAKIATVYAGKTLQTREQVPQGEQARQSLATLFVEGRVFRDVRDQTLDRLEAAALHLRLEKGLVPEQLTDLTKWTLHRLEALGVESGEDLALLSPDDLLAEDLPAWERERLDRHYPRSLAIGDATYRLRYDIRRREVTLVKTGGSRKALPPLGFLPPLQGWQILVRDRNVVRVLRERN